MLKKLLYFFLFYVMFVFSANSQQITYTPQTANGYQFKYLKVDSLFHLSVGDTSLKKGVARAGAIVFRNADSLYYGYNGVRWVLLGGIGKVYADYGLINVNDSTLKADSLQLTTLAKSYKIVDSLDKLYLKLTGGIVTGTVDIQQPLSLGEGGVSRGRLNFFNEDNGNTGSLSSIPYTSNREWLLPDYDGTLTTEDSLRSKTDSLLNIINGRATFGDVRDVVNDSINYVRDNYVTLNTAQTIKGYKTFDTSFTMRHYTDSLNIYDTTRGIVLENTNGATGNSNSITPEGDRITPLIRFKNNVWFNNGNPDAPNKVIPNASNPTEWVIQQRNYSGSQYTYNSNLEIKYKIGTRDYVTVGKFTKDGFVGNISGLLNVTVGGLSAGGNGYFKIKQANTEDVLLTMGTSGSNSYIKNSSSGILFTNSTSTIIGSGSIFGVLVKNVGSIYKVLVGGGDEYSTTPASYFNVKGNAYIGGNANAPSYGLQVVGKTILTGLATNYIYINDSSYTLTPTKKQINVAATTKNVYINLLTSVGNDGQEWSVRRESDTNQYKVIIKPTSGQKINGADSLILFAQNNNVTLKSDGANYIIVDRYNTAKANTPAAAEDLSNISSVTPKKRIYTQTDSVVSVTEYYEVTLTTAGTASSFAVKTPIPTTFTSVYDAIGVGAVTIVDDFTTPTTRKSASAVITSVNASNKVLIQLNDDADSGNTKRIVTLNYQYILK
jgi:hypothetical protein